MAYDKMAAYVIKVLLLVSFVSVSSGLKLYQDRIPNGFRVPHPCFGQQIWNGVGHLNHEGGGAFNPFGEDFIANDKVNEYSNIF